MSSARPARLRWVPEDWTPPEWLEKTPHDDFESYGSEADKAWFDDIPWERRHGESLYDAHVAALTGSPLGLELMRQFYANLVTRRLRQK